MRTPAPARSLVARVTLAGLLAALSVIGLVTRASPAKAAGQAPTMSISPGAAAAGQPVVVSVAGWPAGSATVTVCGDNARRGDPDCDLGGAATIDIDIDIGADGSGSTSLTAAPPVDCPCVVRVGTAGAELVQTLPLDVPGALRVPDRPVAVPEPRQLVVTVRIRPSASSASVVAVPPVDGVLRPGEQRTVVVPFDLPAPVAGRYLVSGQVNGLDQPVLFSAATSSLPWAIIVLVFATVVAVGWWLLGRCNRHYDPTDDRFAGADDQ
jgi:hypothetical protein